MVIWLVTFGSGEICRGRRHAELHPGGPVDAAGRHNRIRRWVGRCWKYWKMVSAKVGGEYIRLYIVIELHHDFLPLAICSGIRIFFVVSFVFISSEFRQTFRRVLCGKTFCHKILPHILSSEFR